MNVLPYEKRVRVVSALVDGTSVRAASRVSHCHRDTALGLSVEIGEACQHLHNALMTDLAVDVLEFDEIWGFVRKKQRRVRDDDPEEFGDTYTFIGLAASQKAIVSYHVGKRTADAAMSFAKDTRRRVTGSPQISTDGFQSYPGAIAAAFGQAADYAMIIKQYGNPEDNKGEPDIRYSRSKCTRAEKVVISGAPDHALISTSYVERQNLTMRMCVRRATRLTNGFSKCLRNHRAAISLYVAHYNFVRVHETLKATPAMALGVTERPWSVAELIDTALQIAPPDPEPEPVAAAPAPEEDPQLSLLDWTPRQVLRPASRPDRPLPPTRQLPLFPDLSFDFLRNA